MVVKGLTTFVRNNTIIICATVIVIWAISAATVLIVTGNADVVRAAVLGLSPIITSLLTLFGLNQRVKEAKQEVEAVHQKITNGDTTDVTS
jgi:hypothetical protein